MIDPGQYRSCLAATAFAHLRESCQSLSEGDYLASAVWGAVFLEALLDDFARERRLQRPGQDDLNGRIQQLQQCRNSGKIPDLPEEIIKRCDDIRNTRNRLVHDTGAAKTTLAQDAQFIHAGLEVILDWFKGAVRPQALNDPTPPAAGGKRVPMFLSTVNPHQNARQSYFLEELGERLRRIGVEPIRFIPTLYDKHDPIGRVCELMRSCRAATIIGLERTHAYFLRDKEGTPEEKEAVHRQYTSGWLHLEAGIAHALGLEVFVLCQKGIHSDGIFDRGWNTYPVAEVDSLRLDSEPLNQFLRHLEAWALRIQESGPGPSADPAPDRPLGRFSS